MASSARFGSRVRAVRRRAGLTQAKLAEQLGISASYLNLIEHDKRPLPAALLLEIARRFELDLSTFGTEDTARLHHDLMELFGDDLFEPYGLSNTEVRDLVVDNPAVGRAVVALYEAWRQAQEQAQTFAARVATDEQDATRGRAGSPSDEVNDFLQRNHDHFPTLETAAETLWRDAALDLNALQGGLVGALDAAGVDVRFVHAGTLGRAVRRYDPERKVLSISEVLPPRSRHFQLAHMVGLLTEGDQLDRLTADPWLTTPDSKRLARVVLANYYAGAVLMPYAPFLEAARACRYDVELLGHRFRVSFEQVCHRLTTLQRPGAAGVPFHLIRIDIAGNVAKKFSASSMRFPRYGGLCPKWNVFQAFLAAGRIRTQVSRMSEKRAYFSISRTLHKGEVGYHHAPVIHAIELGCDLDHARDLVYADGMDLGNPHHAVETGITCRLCQRADCEQRVAPSIYEQVPVDENVRGLAFYVKADA